MKHYIRIEYRNLDDYGRKKILQACAGTENLIAFLGVYPRRRGLSHVIIELRADYIVYPEMYFGYVVEDIKLPTWCVHSIEEDGHQLTVPDFLKAAAPNDVHSEIERMYTDPLEELAACMDPRTRMYMDALDEMAHDRGEE